MESSGISGMFLARCTSEAVCGVCGGSEDRAVCAIDQTADIKQGNPQPGRCQEYVAENKSLSKRSVALFSSISEVLVFPGPHLSTYNSEADGKRHRMEVS